MLLQARMYVVIVLLLPFFQAAAMQDGDPDVVWYERFFSEDGQPLIEEAMLLGRQQLEQARTEHDHAGQVKALTELGLIQMTRAQDYEKAMDFFIRSLALADSAGVGRERIFTYLAMAHVLEDIGDYPKSEELLQQALAINERDSNPHILVLVLNKLGKINAAMDRTDEAFGYYERVLEHKDQLGSPKVEAEALSNLAHLYAQQDRYHDALDSHKQALALWRSAGDRKGEALSLNDIGVLYSEMKNTERALANHVVALEIRRELDDKKGMAESYNHIGVLYFEQKNTERAIANLNPALQAAREAQDQLQMRKSYDYLGQCYTALGDYKTALEYKDLFLAINDFIQHDKNEQQLLEAQNRYVIEKKETQIDRLESVRAQRERELLAQKRVRNFLITFFVLVFIIALLVAYMYVLKQRSNKELKAINNKVKHQNQALQDLNATKDKFFSIISHDLKGPLNSLTSFSGLLMNHTDSLSKEEIQMLAKDLDKSLKNLFALLENLLEWSRSQTGNIDFTPEVFDLAAVLAENSDLLRAQAQNKNIAIINNHEGGDLPVKAHRQSVNTVVRNLLSNAIKFTPEGGTVTLGAQQAKGEVIVSIADTGVGMSPDVIKKLFRLDAKHSTEGTAKEKGTGLGLILCKEFIEKNGGMVLVESEEGKGSVFYFTLPLAGG